MEARLIRAARAEVQPPGEDLAPIRLPQGGYRRGVPAHQGRARGEGRRRLHLPGAVRQRVPRTAGEGGAGGGLPDPTLHEGHGRADPVRAVRPGRHGAVPDALRRPRRSRALRRARPEARLLPDLPGRAPRSARTTHGRPRPTRSGTRRRRWFATGSGRSPTRWLGPARTPGSSGAGRSRSATGIEHRGSNGGSLVRGDGAEPIPLPCPRERADELAAVRAWVRSHRPRIVEGEAGLAEPVDGGAAIARIQAQARTSDDRRAGARPRS